MQLHPFISLSGCDKSTVEVDWPFIDMLEKSPQKLGHRNYINKKHKDSAPTSKDPQPKFEFRREDFEDAVVMPSYRNMDQPQYFYVAEIRTDLTPRSPFPSPELYDTFAAYYTAKYSLAISAPEQPLLDVDHTSARLNLLTPRYMNQKGGWLSIHVKL